MRISVFSRSQKIFGLGLLLAAILFAVLGWNQLRGWWKEFSYRPQTRIYYIAAENVVWDFAPAGKSQPDGGPLPLPWGERTKYDAVRYVAYTDDSFTTVIPQPAWLGILGPIIRGVPGDTIKVVFFNRADKPYSIHPHGVKYDRDNEGATMEMNGVPTSDPAMPMKDAAMPMNSMAMPMQNSPMSLKGASSLGKNSPMATDGKGAAIQPGEKYTYTWTVRDDAAPAEGEGGSKVWLYHSHVDSVQDIYDGLVGPIIITSKRHANADGTPDDTDREFVTLFLIFDESKPEMSAELKEASQKHAINGFIFGNLPGLTMKVGERVRWYVMGLGNEDDLHTPHWHGNVVHGDGTTTDVLEILPGSMHTVNMIPDDPGSWMFHCHVADHIKAGMFATYTVTN